VASKYKGSRFSLAPKSEKNAPKRIERFAVFDIEAANWIDFLIAGYYDGEIYREFLSLDEFLEYLDDDANNIPTDIFAHFGGIYDFLFILQGCFDGDLFRPSDFIPRGSGILCFTLTSRRSGRRIVFRDSGALLPFSLSKITESFGVAHKKQKLDVSNLTHVTDELAEYLSYDCIGLYESLKKFFASPLNYEAGHKTTMASQALQIFRGFITEQLPACPRYIDAFVRRGYAGGRTEIFRPLFEGPGELHCYDVNSLYPAVMRENDFPTRFDEVSKELNLSRMGFTECDVEVPIDTYLPVLWQKDSKTGRFIFPVGKLSGVWPNVELAYALKHGAKITSVKGAAYFSNGGKIFKNFVDTLYKIRQHSKDEVQNIVAKLTMNSLYGRMGLNTDREGLELDYGQENVKPHFQIKTKKGIIQFVKTETELSTFSNVAIAAYVTAYARIHMHKLIRPIQSEVYYMDTDSVFTTRILDSSKALGKLKHEYSVNKACFILPKSYRAGDKIALKGFDKRKAAKFSHEDFLAHMDGEMRLKEYQAPKIARLKTALRNGKFLHMNKATTRQIRARYDKRELYKLDGNWETKPLEV